VTKIIVVTSGKGGVGKTTSSASFASGLALRGKKTAVIDFDVGLRNLDLIMGCERRVVYDMINVINREATLTQALIKDKHCDNLFVLPASQTRDKDALSEEGVERILEEMKNSGFEYIVCDSPAGIERGAVMALTFADEAISFAFVFCNGEFVLALLFVFEVLSGFVMRFYVIHNRAASLEYLQ
jgi:septum site-determining protein MinD